MTRLVQIQHAKEGRRVAVVLDSRLCLLTDTGSVYELAQKALDSGSSLEATVEAVRSKEFLDYDPIYEGRSDWHLLPPIDQPQEPTRCLVTGTGLTHKKSAENRQAMHTAQAAPVTDSMRMYQWGLEGGHPAQGEIGSQPEWFYKGTGEVLRAHGEPLEVPSFGFDGGDEAEVAGIYIVDHAGNPRRIGFAQGNEFSDHKLESKSYLYLAHSKLRYCAIGPELVVTAEIEEAHGTVRIFRGQAVLWSKPFATGEKNMSHSIANLEHHHFKYPQHRHPGDLHVHFFGADSFSYGEGIELVDGDIMEVELAGFGRPLRNPLRVDRSKPPLVEVKPL